MKDDRGCSRPLPSALSATTANQPYPNSFVRFIIADSFHTNRVWKKRQAIVSHILRANLGEDFPEIGIGHPPVRADRDLVLDDTSPRSRVGVAAHP
jgi:hypothetical protein